MKRKVFISLISLIFVASSSVAFSSYIINGNKIPGLEENPTIDVNGQEDLNYKKVTFNAYSSSTGTLSELYFYVKSGETISLNDLPNEYRNALIERKTSDGKNILAASNYGFTQGIKVTSDLVFSANQLDLNAVTPPDSSNVERDENNVDQDGNVNVSGNTIRVEEGNNNRDTTTEINLDKPIFNGSIIESTFKDQDGNEATSQDLHKTGEGDTTSYQHTMDQTIGLEDPTSEKSYYKPNSGTINSTIDQNNVNNCVTRIKLANDTVLANTTMTIGARVGYCRWGSDSSQTNFQGFIVGSYNELDLCGNTLIVSSGSTLNLYGSLVDSAGGGKVIVENGGVLKATFVVEDMHHETSIPAAYSLGDAPFKSFRSPYLNADIQFNKGSKFIGWINIDLGSDSNTNMYTKEINFIGDNDTYIMNTSSCSNESYILREPYWDEEIIAGSKNESGTKEDIAYQKFKYKIYDCASLSVNTPNFETIEYTGYAFDIIWDRCDFFIPNYFDVYLYNSKATIKNNLVFMPGSYLYVDENSEIVLSAKDYGKYSKDWNIGDVALPSEIKIHDFYQAVGGLLFVDKKYNYTEINKYCIAEDSSKLKIFTGTTNFWSFLNQNRKAKADIYGKISFDTSKSLYKELYHLGGTINIYNLDAFISSVNNSSQYVELYNSAFYGGPCHFNLGRSVYFNVTDYYGLPLISNGNVLTSMTSGLNTIGLRSDCKTNIFKFDYDTGVISGNSKTYIPIFMDKKGTYNNWCNHVNKTCYKPKRAIIPSNRYDVNNWKSDNDDSRIVFNECTYDSTNNIANYNGQNYIYFRGGFFKYNGSGVDIYKFRNYGANEGDNNNSYKAVVLKQDDSFYGYNAWRLV